MASTSIDTTRYVAFEGIEGAGKSTVSRHVATRLADAGHEVVRVREPGGTEVGEAVRSILLDGAHDPAPRSEAALFAAARAQLIDEVVKPALVAGAWVLSDRSAYSSLAYQAGGRGIDLDEVRRLNDIAIDGVWPGTVVLLRLDADTGLRRQAVGDRIGDEGRDFHVAVAQTFDRLAAEESDRFIVVDGALPIDDVVDLVLDGIGV